MRHPILFNLQQFDQARHGHFLIKLRNGQPVGGTVHAGKIVPGTEQLQPTVLAAVALHALENALAIMQHHAGRIHLKLFIGLNPGVAPAVLAIILHNKHIIGEPAAKAQLALVLGLVLISWNRRHANIVHLPLLHLQWQSPH